MTPRIHESYYTVHILYYGPEPNYGHSHMNYIMQHIYGVTAIEQAMLERVWGTDLV